MFSVLCFLYDYLMPKLPDPTLSPVSPGQSKVIAETPVVASGKKAAVSDVKSSPFHYIGPFLVALFIAAVGFAVMKYLVLPRFKKPEAITIAYWGLWEPASVMAPVIAKFEEENPGIKVDYQMQLKTDYRERLQSAVARGEGPDIMRLHATWLPMFREELSPASADQFSTNEFSQAFYPAAAEDLVKNGSVMAVPLGIDGLGLFINNQMLAATDSGVPKNWDEFRKTAFALTKRDSRGQIVQSGAAMGTTGNVAHWSDILAVLLLQNSVDPARPDATVDAKGRNLGADALRFYTIFSTQDRVWDETLPPDTVAFANGKVAMIIAPSWEAFGIMEKNKQLDFSIHPIPQLIKERKVTWASYWVDGVSAKSKHPKEAWKFLKYLSGAEALQMMYSEETKLRPFGEPYPRRDMAKSLETAKYVNTFVSQAVDAKSWYMSTATGDNGINDEIIAYWADAVNSVNQQKTTPEVAIITAAKGVQQVLSKYGVK